MTFKLAHFTKLKVIFPEVSMNLITWPASNLKYHDKVLVLYSCLDLVNKGTRVLLCDSFVIHSQFNSSGKSPSHHRISVISSAPKYQPPAGRLKGEGATPWRPGEEPHLGNLPPGGGGVLPENLTPFTTKFCDFCYPIYDLAKNSIAYL